MSLKHGILGLLANGPMTGYELSNDFNTSLSLMWHAQQSQVYRELGDLEKNGYVTSTIIPQEGKPSKKQYTITDIGLQELVDWVNEYHFKESMKVRDAFALRIFFSARGNFDELRSALHAYIEWNEALLKKLEDIEQQHLPPERLQSESDALYWLISLRKGRYTFRANIDWGIDTLGILDQLNHEGTQNE
ncbi:PadR family transcriptional regulator [Lysinibacillus piscis]|uniref:Transcriptional regulator n=1 Tax=Lysinibacillus piscis TaxID=2518931 RepID=A0ABQ5NJ42_9BACI|nr:PadR family transcriptional regulator [Lysinibacillus sp. KH24]GLC88295.1 transcriptional regulator [Lysinibacillus sp. KH24]